MWCSWLALATLALTALTANGGATQLRDQRPLAALLARRGDRAVYGDYWLVDRLAFLSGERLIPVAALPDRRPALNRYPPYLARAAGTARISWVVPAGGAAERSLRQCLAARRLRYARVLLSDGPMAGRETLAIYDRFSAPACRLLP